MYALIIAGGRGERLAASAPTEVPVKPLLQDATGRRLIDRVLDACTVLPECRRIVVAGEMPLPDDVTRVREDPPLAGPAAGIAAGVTAIPADYTGDVLVLPADLAAPASVVAALDRPGVITADGRLQPLLFRASCPALKDACVGDFTDAPVLRIVKELHLSEIELPAPTVADIDTWADAAAHGYSNGYGQD
jgi:CTP:molybdopterin cytidylyltransferase MocA